MHHRSNISGGLSILATNMHKDKPMRILTAIASALTPVSTPVPMSEHETFFDFAEKEVRRTLDDLRAAFNAHFERSTKVLTLLTAGAGAVAAYTVNEWENQSAPALAALLVMALLWALDAIYLATHVMRSHTMDAGGSLEQIAQTYRGEVDLMTPQPASLAKDAMRLVRMAELNREQASVNAYSSAVTAQTAGLRRVLVMAAAVPLVAMLVAAVVSRF